MATNVMQSIYVPSVGFYYAGVKTPVIGQSIRVIQRNLADVEFDCVSRDGHVVSNSTLIGAEVCYLRVKVKGSY